MYKISNNKYIIFKMDTFYPLQYTQIFQESTAQERKMKFILSFAYN